MKNRLLSKLILMAVCCLSAAWVSADVVTLYRPEFAGNANSNNLGFGGATTAQSNLSFAVWQAAYGPSGTANNTAQSGATIWTNGFIQGNVALVTDCRNLTNPYRSNNALLWTENFSATTNVQNLTEIMFVLNNGAANVSLRLAIRVGGDWFASTNAYVQKVAGAQERTTLTAADLAAMNWYSLDFTSGVQLALDTGSSVAFSGLSGDIDAAGVYYDNTGTERVRLREFSVTAIPEPATLGLMAIGAVLAMAVRRYRG